MNKDKMTPTEEKAQAYADTRYGKVIDDICRGIPAVNDALRRAYLAGAKGILSLPLSERLTEEEKEKIRAMYKETESWLEETRTPEKIHDPIRLIAVALQDRFEQIFGTDFFKEGGNDGE